MALLCAVAQPVHAQTITLDLNGETRGEALARLVPVGSAQIEWKNPALADQPVQGHFEGNEQQVLKEILAPADFAAVYADSAGGLKITKLIVLDKEAPASGPAQTTPVVEPPPNQLQQQQRLQQQRLQQQQQQLQQQQLQQQRSQIQRLQRLQQQPMPGVQNGQIPRQRRRQPLPQPQQYQ
jgi:hypothetical protein